MKKCFKCGIEKPLSDYYKHKQMKDGHLNKCIQCTKDDSNKHRSDNIEKVRDYDRKRGQSEERKQKNKDYQEYMKKFEPERWRKMRYEATKKQRAKSRFKYIAKSRVQYAKKTGKLKQLNCEVCGSTKTEAHHPDYSKPLDVIWLCDKCHKEEHKRLKAEARNNI